MTCLALFCPGVIPAYTRFLTSLLFIHPTDPLTTDDPSPLWVSFTFLRGTLSARLPPPRPLDTTKSSPVVTSTNDVMALKGRMMSIGFMCVCVVRIFPIIACYRQIAAHQSAVLRCFRRCYRCYR